MIRDRPFSRTRPPIYLIAMLAVYCGASLIHFTHNATFIADYPNLPAWLGSAQVYEAWIAITLVGVAGIIVMLRGFRRIGLIILMIYAAFGLDGLDHYTRAPISAHTFAMNATIWFEVMAATVLLITLVALMFCRSLYVNGIRQ